MADTALALGLLYALCCLAVVVSAVRFLRWVLDSDLREKQFYAGVVCAAVAGCSVIPAPGSFLQGEFFSNSDSWHRDWVARVKADKL